MIPQLWKRELSWKEWRQAHPHLKEREAIMLYEVESRMFQHHYINEELVRNSTVRKSTLSSISAVASAAAGGGGPRPSSSPATPTPAGSLYRITIQGAEIAPGTEFDNPPAYFGSVGGQWTVYSNSSGGGNTDITFSTTEDPAPNLTGISTAWNVSSITEYKDWNGATTDLIQSFTACSNLQSVYFPEVKYLANLNTFRDCTSLTSVYMPKLNYVGVANFMNNVADSGSATFSTPFVGFNYLPTVISYLEGKGWTVTLV